MPCSSGRCVRVVVAVAVAAQKLVCTLLVAVAGGFEPPSPLASVASSDAACGVESWQSYGAIVAWSSHTSAKSWCSDRRLLCLASSPLLCRLGRSVASSSSACPEVVGSSVGLAVAMCCCGRHVLVCHGRQWHRAPRPLVRFVVFVSRGQLVLSAARREQCVDALHLSVMRWYWMSVIRLVSIGTRSATCWLVRTLAGRVTARLPRCFVRSAHEPDPRTVWAATQGIVLDDSPLACEAGARVAVVLADGSLQLPALAGCRLSPGHDRLCRSVRCCAVAGGARLLPPLVMVRCCRSSWQVAAGLPRPLALRGAVCGPRCFEAVLAKRAHESARTWAPHCRFAFCRGSCSCRMLVVACRCRVAPACGGMVRG